MNNYIVYCHTLKCDGRKYIGITCQKAKNRWRHDGTGYKQSTHFFNAINRYKWDNFEHTIIYEGLSKEEAELKEIELIKKYKTTNPKYGFNILEGGKVRNNYKHSIEANQKISKAMKGRPANNKGITPSKEVIEKRRKANIGKHKQSEEHKRILFEIKSKKVLCVEKNIVFSCLREASDYINGNRHIVDVCKGRRETAGGFHWVYI